MSRLMIIGAGPTGIGAARRADELGCEDVVMLEANEHAGGLSASFIDKRGFCWDQGVHLQFSHYDKYDEFLDDVIPREDWTWHQRRSAVWIHDRFVPYPFQLNLHQLPRESCWKCLEGLYDLHGKERGQCRHFKDWVLRTFGEGIADEFLIPYNEKIWATPCDNMNATWVGERVAVPDFKEVLQRICFDEDNHDWGPNARYRYPRWGGTGRIWSNAVSSLSPSILRLGHRVVAIDPYRKEVITNRGGNFSYDSLVSTLPITQLLDMLPEGIQLREAESLRATQTLIVGIGVQGECPKALQKLIWGYYPDPEVSFYRMTILSNLSPHMVPDPNSMWSILMEVAFPPESECHPELVTLRVERDLQRLGFLNKNNRVISRWSRHLNYGYPVPTRERDEILRTVMPSLESLDIYSRGRFGGWKYEVSNQDHSFMQGVEVVEQILEGQPELTYFDPDLINARRNPFPYEEWKNASVFQANVQ